MILSLSLPSFSSENEKKGEVGHSSEHPAWTFHPCVLLCKAGWELLVQALCVASHPLGAVPFTVISTDANHKSFSVPGCVLYREIRTGWLYLVLFHLTNLVLNYKLRTS